MTDSKSETAEEEPMITMRLSEWLRMDEEIRRLRSALEAAKDG